MKKLLIIVIVFAVLAVVSFAFIDNAGARHTCHEVFVYSPPDGADKFQVLAYTHDGIDYQHKMPRRTRFVGLKPGEKAGLSLITGRISGILYDENYYLLDEKQLSRIYLAAYKDNSLAKPVKKMPLNLGCRQK